MKEITEKDVRLFLHCRDCGNERPIGQSPSEWARINVGITTKAKLVILCMRHGKIVGVFQLDPAEKLRLAHLTCEGEH